MSAQNLASAHLLVHALVQGAKISELLSRKSALTMEAVSNQSQIPFASL